MKKTGPLIHLLIALLLIVLFWAIGAWAARTGKLEWALVALVAIVFAWIYAGVAWLQWVKLRRDISEEKR